MFFISRVRVSKPYHVILDVQLYFKNESLNKSLNIITLILGKNGVGKSFLLKTIIDIFLFLEKAKTCKRRKPKFEYSEFEISYTINHNEYQVSKSEANIYSSCNGEQIDYRELELPSIILAFAFMVNDKFRFSKDIENQMYSYHGVRSSSNSTYTSSINRRVYSDVLSALKEYKYDLIKTVLDVLEFDPQLCLRYTGNEKEYEKEFFVDLCGLEKHRTSSIYEDVDYYEVLFYKNRQQISFDSCSSGEKHLLFTFLGIINRIQDSGLVIIDEPEISLHPDWQIKYIDIINRIASIARGCHLMIASHSHYLVSGLRPNQSSIAVLSQKRNDYGLTTLGETLPFSTFAWSAENIIYNVFGVRTTRNYYFEQELSKLINALKDYNSNRKSEVQNMIWKFRNLIEGSNDPLREVVEEAQRIIDEK